MRRKILLFFCLALLCLMQGQATFHHECAVCDCNDSIKKLETEILAVDEKLKAIKQISITRKEEITEFLRSEFHSLIQEIIINQYPGPSFDGDLGHPKQPDTTTTARPSSKFNKNLLCTENCESPKDLADTCRSAESDGVYLLLNTNLSRKPFGAYFQMDGNSDRAWMIVQRRMNGAVDFNRNWEDYKNGFGSPDGEYWLGLERMHQITSQSDCELWIQFRNSTKHVFNAHYGKFKIASESKGYKLSVDDYSADPQIATDTLKINNGQEFFTFDRAVKAKNDDKKAACAKSEESGWWFRRDCSWCNLNGLYPYPKAPQDKRLKIYWKFGLDSDILEYVHMAIRPVSETSASNLGSNVNK